MRFPSVFGQSSVGLHYDAGSLTSPDVNKYPAVQVDRRLVHRRVWPGILWLPSASNGGTPIVRFRMTGFSDSEPALVHEWTIDSATAYSAPSGVEEPVRLIPHQSQGFNAVSTAWGPEGVAGSADCMEIRTKFGNVFAQAIIPPMNLSGDFTRFELRLMSFADAAAGSGEIIMALGVRSQLIPFGA